MDLILSRYEGKLRNKIKKALIQYDRLTIENLNIEETANIEPAQNIEPFKILNQL